MKKEKKKFYKNKEFVKLQSEWYDKLKKEGFDDIEWFDPKTGIGQGSPYLKTKGSVTQAAIERNHTQALAQHYRICRNFLQNGPFYLNLTEKYCRNDQIFDTYANFGAFLADQAQKYTLAESILWECYCSGFSIRDISIELRRLYKLRLLDRVPKRWGKACKGLPFSVFWVKKTLDRLKLDCTAFNLNDSEGLASLESAEDSEGVDFEKGESSE